MQSQDTTGGLKIKYACTYKKKKKEVKKALEI